MKKTNRNIQYKFAVLLGLTLPLFGAETTSTERLNFAPGGTIRLDRSYGDLHVEGWDRPEVEVTVVKSMPFDFHVKHPEQAEQRLEAVRIVTERHSDTELTISTTPVSRHGGVMAEYEIHVPRDSRLVIHHGTGFVSVSGVAGDIEASAGRGDILLWLPPGSYSIDAKSKAGKVSSEFEGAALNQYLFGQRFTSIKPPPSHRLHLRMGFGGITIMGILP
jgi:hypothetical protein